AGVEHVVLATSYRAEVFEAYFGDGADLGLRIDYVTETQPMGTGGGIRNVAERLESKPDDPVLIFNGDVLSGHDLTGQLDLHANRAADVTLHLVEVEDPRAFGCVPVDDEQRVTAFIEKSDQPVTNRINAGCYVFARRVIDAIPAGRPVSVERETFPGLLDSGATVLGYVETAYWLDVGTPAAFVQGSADVVRGVLPSPAMPGAPGDALILGDAVVDAAAVVHGGAVVGAGARVGREAEVDGAVVGDNARIEPGAVVVRSVIGDGAVVGPGTVVRDAVIGDEARLGAGIELAYGARVWPEVALADGAVRFSSDV
ncbi:MAG TPA: NDP-sugar synthase, partial [Mycobacteriales bacterium]|nr:NDP-sugar synthase [Mycobacteriales bacterium]